MISAVPDNDKLIGEIESLLGESIPDNPSDKYELHKRLRVVLDEAMSYNDSFIDPIIEKIARNENVSVDEVMLATFEKNFPNSVIESCWKDKELGGYCTVCGKDI